MHLEEIYRLLLRQCSLGFLYSWEPMGGGHEWAPAIVYHPNGVIFSEVYIATSSHILIIFEVN